MDASLLLPSSGLSLLRSLEEMRQSRVVVHCTSDSQPRRLAMGDVPHLTRCVREMSHPGRLTLVLHSDGGTIEAAREFALQLRAYAGQLEIFVHRKARSAATLLCLAADRIVLGPAAEFGPIDPQIMSAGDAEGQPKRISSEDIKAFRAMAETWFDLRAEESRLEIFKILNQRFFPTTLGAFFRADRYARRVADELLAYAAPHLPAAGRAQVVERLMTSLPDHDEAINRRDILALGLDAAAATDEETRVMCDIVSECQQHMADGDGRDTRGRIKAVHYSTDSGIEFFAPACITRSRADLPAGDSRRPGAAGPVGRWRRMAGAL